jgi:hypothetical protein
MNRWLTNPVLAAAVVYGFGAMLMAAQNANLTLHLTPTVVQENQNLHLVCHIPPDPQNRAVGVGIEGWVLSEHPYDRLTYDVVFTHIPCDVDTAFCQVIRANGRIARTVQKFVVVCLSS